MNDEYLAMEDGQMVRACLPAVPGGPCCMQTIPVSETRLWLQVSVSRFLFLYYNYRWALCPAWEDSDSALSALDRCWLPGCCLLPLVEAASG